MDDFTDAVEFAYRQGWSDGLPVMPPTKKRVLEFLDYMGLDPSQIVGEIPERARTITAEKLAINAVMAGCLPEYMPILVATVEAITDPVFKFNHLASLGSPWPLIIVNGPITKEIGLNAGIYLFGPGSRPNATIARAISLLLRNCAEAKAEGIQRGQWGNPNRWCGCIAENEDTEWVPLNVQRGYERGANTVTVISTYPGVPNHATTLSMAKRPEEMLNPVCHAMATYGAAMWAKGVYTAIVEPHFVEMMVREGWSKEDMRNYIVENTKASIADLKFRGAWGTQKADMSEDITKIKPGDESTYLYLFKDNGEHDSYLWSPISLKGRVVDVFVVVAGGNAGHRVAVAIPYNVSSNPVSKAIKVKEAINKSSHPISLAS